MSRNTVTITDTTLSVEPHGLDKMWSYTSRLEILKEGGAEAIWLSQSAGAGLSLRV